MCNKMALGKPFNPTTYLIPDLNIVYVLYKMLRNGFEFFATFDNIGRATCLIRFVSFVCALLRVVLLSI